MLALMKPSNVATRSSTRGTSCGFTVVTRTSGGGGAVCAGLREQLGNDDSSISSAPTRVPRFIVSIIDAFDPRGNCSDLYYPSFVPMSCLLSHTRSAIQTGARSLRLSRKKRKRRLDRLLSAAVKK